MRALQITGVEKCTLTKLARPQIAADQVLLKVLYVGLCGSDLNTYRGLNPLAPYPRIPGHEISATIVEKGSAISASWQEGDLVTVLPYTQCNSCSSCRKGRFNACRNNKTLGVQQEGGLCEYIAVTEDKLIAAQGLSALELALVEPLSVGFHALSRAKIEQGDTVALFGCGMIGMGVMAAAIAKGAKVVAIDISDEKLAFVRSLGCQFTINPLKQDLNEEIARITQGHGVDLAVEAAGADLAFRQCIDIACYSGQVVYVGYAKKEIVFDTKLFNLKELSIYGSRNASRADMEAAIAYLGSISFDYKLFISKVYELDQAEQALPHWHNHQHDTVKMLVRVS